VESIFRILEWRITGKLKWKHPCGTASSSGSSLNLWLASLPACALLWHMAIIQQ
jgi:hypothetical protein